MRARYWILLLLVGSIAWGQNEKPWERGRRERQDAIGGVPPQVLAKQKLKKVERPSLEEAIASALEIAGQAATEAIPLRAPQDARTLRVPDDFATIRAAIEAARAGDTVLVKSGTYYELLDLKDGVRLVSDASDGGDEPVAVEGARLKLPRRTLRTILDASKSEPSSHGMIDFEPGAGRGTVVDGFTIQHLPKQDHHKPGHAHAINVRGASPIVTNCLVRRNGSTGIGSHVIYHDQGQPLDKRDFRRANVKHESKALILGNLVHGNFGLGIGCNHLSAPLILGNEVFGNDDSGLGEPSPGIGCKHGAAPQIVGNIVHGNAGGGILSEIGERQGAQGIDAPTHPEVRANVVYDNGKNRPGIGAKGAGSAERPVRLLGNCLWNGGAVGVGLSAGAVGIVLENRVFGAAGPGIAVNNATALKLERNEVAGSNGPGFVIVAGAVVWEMTDNAADSTAGPRFLLRDSTIKATPHAAAERG